MTSPPPSDDLYVHPQMITVAGQSRQGPVAGFYAVILGRARL